VEGWSRPSSKIIDDPDGASRNALTGDRDTGHGKQKKKTEPAACYHLNANHITSMMLRGQHKVGREDGYAMVVLLIGLSIMAILMTVAMPA
jgi:hypothetical protein